MTARQVIFVMVMFILGSSIILGVNVDAKQDSWIALLIAVVMSVPLLLIYARIIKLCPGENIFDMAERLFGKVIGKIIIILMTWYALHLGAMVLRNFYVYIEVTALSITPHILIMILLMLTTLYIAKSGAAVLGRWGIIVFPVVLIMVIITVLFSIPSIEIKNIFPIMEHSLKSVAGSAFKSFSFPFAETVLLLCIACFFKKEDSSYKIYMSGLFISGLVLLVVLLRNLTVLGAPMMAASYFPSHLSARVIELGDIWARIEGVVTINFIFADITKIAVCLFAASMGMAKLFAIKNYKNMLMPASLLIIMLCAILYTNITEMLAFIDIYAIYAIPFQILIPLIIWIVAEKKARDNKVSN